MSNYSDSEAQAFADGVLVGEMLGAAELEVGVGVTESGQTYSVKRRGETIAEDLDELQLEAFARGYVAGQGLGR